MKLSKHTIEVLKNFATINPNIVISPGQQLKTIAEAKNILASAEITEDFAEEFGIYDLNEFLSAMNLLGDPDLTFGEKSVLIQADGQGSVKYFFSEKDVVTSPTKEVTMPNPEVSVNISEASLNQIRKAAAVLGHNELALCGKNGVITAKVLDDKDATTNTYALDLDSENDCKNEFTFIVNISNLKLLPGDYYVSISSKLVSYWTNSSIPVNYYIALEKGSEYHV
jgi:hypothetical protein